ncbi:MAG: RNA polymerase sigma-70 factor (ECF subfamily) [Bacteroidia bacterium]
MIEQKHTDKQLIELVLNGDQEMFAHIVNRYKDRVAAISFNMVKDKNLAEEVGQETFIRLFKSLGQYNYKSAMSTYITRIAINLSLNKLDSIKRRQNRFTSQDDSHNVFASNDALISSKMETKELVQIALQHLNPEARSVVVLRMIEGYSVKETSSLLGIAEGTVMSKLNRAMKKMKETLDTYTLKNE